MLTGSLRVPANLATVGMRSKQAASSSLSSVNFGRLQRMSASWGGTVFLLFTRKTVAIVKRKINATVQLKKDKATISELTLGSYFFFSKRTNHCSQRYLANLINPYVDTFF